MRRFGSADDPAIVLTHGLADSSDTWDLLVPLLARRASVVTWDLPGHGTAGRPNPDDGDGDRAAFNRDGAVDLLARVVSEAGAPATLVGHSLGGYLSLTLALRYPALVRSLVLLSSGPGFRDPTTRASWNDYIDRVAMKNRLDPGVAAVGYQPDSFVLDTVSSLACPLLHIIGGDDARYRAGAQYLRRVVGGSELVELADAGHHPERTAPGETAAAILRMHQRIPVLRRPASSS